MKILPISWQYLPFSSRRRQYSRGCKKVQKEPTRVHRRGFVSVAVCAMERIPRASSNDDYRSWPELDIYHSGLQRKIEIKEKQVDYIMILISCSIPTRMQQCQLEASTSSRICTSRAAAASAIRTTHLPAITHRVTLFAGKSRTQQSFLMLLLCSTEQQRRRWARGR